MHGQQRVYVRSSLGDVEKQLPGYVSGIREWFRWPPDGCFWAFSAAETPRFGGFRVVFDVF